MATALRQPGQLNHPASQVTPQQLYAIVEDLGVKLMAAVQQIGGNQAGELIYRDLVPNDLFVSTAQPQGRFYNPIALTANAFTTDVFSGAGNALPQNKAIGFYGVYNLAASPQVNEVRIKLGTAQTLAQIFLDPVYAEAGSAPVITYFNPIRFGPLDPIVIDMLSSVAVGSGGEQVGFLGVVAETAGVTISPRLGGGPLIG